MAPRHRPRMKKPYPTVSGMRIEAVKNPFQKSFMIFPALSALRAPSNAADVLVSFEFSHTICCRPPTPHSQAHSIRTKLDQRGMYQATVTTAQTKAAR